MGVVVTDVVVAVVVANGVAVVAVFVVVVIEGAGFDDLKDLLARERDPAALASSSGNI